MPDHIPTRAEPANVHGRGCWYRIDIRECVLCGRTREDRERQWGPRSAEPSERIHYTQDACGHHFA